MPLSSDVNESAGYVNISIDRSLEITNAYEQNAILELITKSKYYDAEMYGSKAFMRAQWVAHNTAYDMASSSKIGNWITRKISNASNPVQSAKQLDIRCKKNMGRKSRFMYWIMSWNLRK